ncbi:Serine/threonine protein kinase [Handroanthus impetiginosus]|uniref:Serine/threonine protein kinase n=1 Tax=Handroanthus impetiginosus TaxID=429701 RepID=A0A2G9H5U4_9LAMI|nr:Serine/threonine protein kinase [Handroanthus impetiginosus]
MSAIYDNWERLVAAVLKREQLWQLFHAQSRSPSVLSEASSFSSSFNIGSPVNDLPFDFSSLGISSRLQNPKVVLISDFSRAFGVNELHLASAELLGRGTFGSAYAVAIDKRVRIVVKRLTGSIPEPEFKRHMDIVGNVKHKNVTPLRGYYCSEHERLMLYDYYSNGSVYALFHGQTGENRAHVDWETRLKIAIGAARGIAEIHKQNGGNLVHGNIKSSNIFLDLQHYGCVSDLGLANMIETKFMPRARCYAPEIKGTRHVSQASDVYGFGIVLLELLTRKSTEHLPGGPKPIDLVKLVGSVKSKERAAKVFDADLLKHPTIEEDMVKVLQIGIQCVSKSIKKRPKIFEVVKMLEDIGRFEIESHVHSNGKLVFVEGVIPTFDFEDMLRASAEVLGKGTFGTSYLARLETGDTVVVKRFKDVSATFKEFQRHMEVTGSMRHENVAELRAYYFSRDEKLLVQDYYDEGSLFAALHGIRDTDKRFLDWETRLRIAVDAARGITHIHRQDGRELVHGNIKSSNILITENKHGTVSDVGLAKLMDPIRLSKMPNSGHYAPEVTDTRKASQASDVYSFGVVLMELVSGKHSQINTRDGQVSLVEWIQSVGRQEGTSKVFDVKLLRYPDDEEAMVQVLQIAMDCAANVPEHRPRMPEIVKMLEEISGIGPSQASNLEDVLEDPWGQPSFELRLEYLLEDLLPTLTP